MLETILFVGVVFGSIAGIAFPFYYSYISRGDWKTSGMGQNVMAFAVVFALFYISGYIRILGFNNELWETLSRAVLTYLTAGILWWRLILFRKIHNDAEKELLRLRQGSDANDVTVEEGRVEGLRADLQLISDQDEAILENERINDLK